MCNQCPSPHTLPAVMAMCTRYYMGCLCVYFALFIFVILHNKKQSNDTTERHRSVLSILYICYRGHDRMTVGFATTCAISAYHHYVYSIHHVIKFVSDLGQVGGFLEVSTINNSDHHDIAEILLRLVLNSITQTIRYRKY